MRQTGQFAVVDARENLPRGTTASFLQFLATTGGFGQTLFAELGALALGANEGLDVAEQAFEDAGVVVEILQQCVDDGLQLAVDAAVAIRFRGPSLGHVCQCIQQSACRVLGVREHAPVEDGRLQVGNLQPRQQGLHLGR